MSNLKSKIIDPVIQIYIYIMHTPNSLQHPHQSSTWSPSTRSHFSSSSQEFLCDGLVTATSAGHRNVEVGEVQYSRNAYIGIFMCIYIYIRRPLPWFPVGYSSGPFPCLPSFSLCTFDTSPIYNASQSRSSTRRQMLLVCVGLLQARRSNSRALTMVTFVRPFPLLYIHSDAEGREHIYIYIHRDVDLSLYIAFWDALFVSLPCLIFVGFLSVCIYMNVIL